MTRRFFCCLSAVALALAGCGAPAHRSVNAPVRGGGDDYIDLQPGWRLRVVTPIRKSDGYRIHSATVEAPAEKGDTITVRASPDFLGYEMAFYAIGPERSGGVKIRFASATLYREGQRVPKTAPAVRLFEFPRWARHVRLVFLIRASSSDHNMAVLAVKRAEELGPLTQRIGNTPAACRVDRTAFCGWIPDGIAVKAEEWRGGRWQAVR